jgi:hypothetical protein
LESLKDFAKSKLERYIYTGVKDDIIDILVYLEFIVRRMKKYDGKE